MLLFHLLLLLNLLAHLRNVARLSLFYRYYFGRCSSELSKLVPFPFSQGRSSPYSDGLRDVNSFFPRSGILSLELTTIDNMGNIDTYRQL